MKSTWIEKLAVGVSVDNEQQPTLKAVLDCVSIAQRLKISKGGEVLFAGMALDAIGNIDVLDETELVERIRALKDGTLHINLETIE